MESEGRGFDPHLGQDLPLFLAYIAVGEAEYFEFSFAEYGAE